MVPSPCSDRFSDVAIFGSESVGGSAAAGGRSRRRRPVAVAVLVFLTIGLAVASGAVGASEPDVIYDDGLGPGYQDWSWAMVDTGSAVEVRSGSTAISVDYGPWEGLYLARPTPVPLDQGATLEFWMHGGTGPEATIHVVLVNGSHVGGRPIAVRTTPNRWSRYELPVADFGGSDSFGGLWWQNASADPLAAVHFDDIRLIGPDGTGDGGDGPAPMPGPDLTVHLDARSLTRTVTDPASGQTSDVTIDFPHPISDGVYGLNFAAPSLLDELGPGVNRWGGNAVERYNHRTGITNLGKDWFFMNNPGAPGNDHRFEERNQDAGAETLLTIPAIGWVAGPDGARCGYPADRYGPMDSTKPHFLDGALVCGNGRRAGEVLTGDPELTSVKVGPAHTTAWVEDLVSTHGSAAEGGVEVYAVGNEPGLWHETHSDVVDGPTTRTDIISTNIAHATAVKAADPTAAVAGPVLWSGYSYYVTSAEFAAGERPGDVPTFVGAYLAEMAAAGDRAGIRLLDTLAVNFYDDRVFWGGSDELRLESTRSLWDPTYAPADWWVVRDFVGEGSAVIPRMRSLIDDNYPETELAITEYNFGALDTLAGGLAQADALGIFGREGLDRAMLWDPFNEQLSPPEAEFVNTPAMWAYRMFRNYDGVGSRFGDLALLAESSDEHAASIYAATRTEDGAITVMIINKATEAMTATLTLATSGSAEVFRYGSAGLDSIERTGDVRVDGSIVTTYPARSITLLVIHPDDEPPSTAPPASSTTTAPASSTTAPTTSSTTIRSTTTAPTTTPPTTVPPTTTLPPTTALQTTTSQTVPSDQGPAFFEDFADDGSFDRFETGIYHRDDWVVTETEWYGDHSSIGGVDGCGPPTERRLITRGERETGFNQDWIYRCRPGGSSEKAHLMTSIGDTSGYSIGAFSPHQVFSNVREVRWHVNITDLGARQFPEVKIIPVETFDFQNLPCAIEWLPCNTDNHGAIGSVGSSFFHAEPAINTGSEFVKGYDWDSGWRETGTDPARHSITTRRAHFFRDNEDGTLTFGIETEDGDFETISAPGSFPDGPVRVIFADHNYTPRKGEPADITFSWHWDDLEIWTN